MLNPMFKLRISHFSLAAAAKSLQSCPTLCEPTRLPRPWDSPGNNTGVGCHFLLQCMKVKSESEVTQSCPTLSDTMDCSLPGSSIHGIFQARVLEWDAIAFSVSDIRIHYLEVSLFPHTLTKQLLYEPKKIIWVIKRRISIMKILFRD